MSPRVRVVQASGERRVLCCSHLATKEVDDGSPQNSPLAADLGAREIPSLKQLPHMDRLCAEKGSDLAQRQHPVRFIHGSLRVCLTGTLSGFGERMRASGPLQPAVMRCQ